LFDKNIALQTIQSKIREFLFDTQIEEAEHMSELMGCSPLSEELFNRESDESEKRIKKIEHLIPLAFAYATTLADALIKHELSHSTERTKSPVQTLITRQIILTSAFPAIVAALSQMVDLGLVKPIIKKPRTRKWMKLW
jgi:hypothetical protein